MSYKFGTAVCMCGIVCKWIVLENQWGPCIGPCRGPGWLLAGGPVTLPVTPTVTPTVTPLGTQDFHAHTTDLSAIALWDFVSLSDTMASQTTC